MHKIKRNEPPKGLNEKMIEFNKNKSHTSKEITEAWKSFSNTTLKKKTIEQLKKMFKGCCAYCEGLYEGTSYPQIEHFKPKSLFPELMFDYNNMNIACEICNKNKLDKYDDKLVNPTEDDPNKHLKYKTYVITPLDIRGKYTIDLLHLNSDERTDTRKKCYIFIDDRLQLISQWIEEIERNQEEFDLKFIELINCTVKELEEYFKDDYEFSSMYIHNFKDMIENFKNYL